LTSLLRSFEIPLRGGARKGTEPSLLISNQERAAGTITSINDEIHVLAKQKITLKVGQTSIELDGANITLKTPGLLDVKGTSKSFVGPKGSPAQLPVLPVGLSEFKQAIELSCQYDGLEPVEGAPYKVIFSDGGMRDPKKNGHYPGSVNGQDAREPKGGEGADSREGQDPVAAFARPLMVLDANMIHVLAKQKITLKRTASGSRLA
jgi:uncharacterized protein (DUF2345 family)